MMIAQSRVATPEQALLRWAVRVDVAPFPGELVADIEWAEAQRLALEHGLLPLLYQRVAALPVGNIPAAVLEEWRALYRANTLRNLRMLQSLRRVLRLLEAAGIAAVSVKGAVLAVQAYGDISSRHFVDIDLLLLNPTDFYRAYQTLCAAGLRTDTPVTPAEVPRLQRRVNNHHFRDGEVLMELHWAMPEHEYGFTLDGEALGSRLQTLAVEGKALRTLSLTDTLLLHVLHGAKHQWNKLIWAADLARLQRDPDVDWPGLLAQAKQRGVLRILLSSLRYSERLCGAPMPAAARVLLDADPQADALADYLQQITFLDDAAAIRTFPTFMLNSRERWRDKLTYLTYPRACDQHLPLPPALFPFYYLIRPLRLLGKGLQSLVLR